jgi:predicted phosphodiesterase
LIIALLADIHSNLEALQACLKHASERRAERFAFLGDLVGYGADPGPVIDTVASYAARGAVVVKGNQDDATDEGARDLNEAARDSIEWTRTALSDQQKLFLASTAQPRCRNGGSTSRATRPRVTASKPPGRRTFFPGTCTIRSSTS